MSHLRRPLAVLAAVIGALGGAPAAHAAAPPCSPEVAGKLQLLGKAFVAGRSDNGFGPDIRFATDPVGQFPVASVDESTIVVTAAPPASIRTEDGEPFLVAPRAGPVTITASWEEYPASASACSASDSVVASVLPGRVPAVGLEPAEVPLAIGPVVTWPCPDYTRAIDGASSIVVHYERGLDRAPTDASPSLELKLPEPCELNFRGQNVARGVMTVAAGDYRGDYTRKVFAVYPARARDLRVAIDVRWGPAVVFHHEYAIVSAGQRGSGAARTAVFLTTEPGAAAAAAARRYARQRRGAPYVSPEERLGARREYRISGKGSVGIRWEGGFGAPGEPGCGYVAERGAEDIPFTVLLQGGGGVVHGRHVRTYSQTRDCPPVPSGAAGEGRSSDCPGRGALHGAVYGGVVPPGGLTAGGRRARGTRVLLSISGSFSGGATCPGAGGLQFTPEVDGAAGSVARLRRGRSTTVRLARTLDCREMVMEAAGDATSCRMEIRATVRVRRVR